MNDKQKLAAMGAQYRLTEEQAKGLAERMPQTGALQVIDDEPLCMAKRIEELEARVRALTLPEGWQMVPVEPTREMMASAMSAVTQPQDLLYSQSGWGMNEVAARTRYCAMLSAAPSPDSTK